MSEINKNTITGESAIRRVKQKNLLNRQRMAVILMAVAIVLLIAALLVVNYIVQIYAFDDVDGTRYYVKKVGGSYALCYKNGEVCDKNAEGYYQTDLGTLVKIDSESGASSVYAVVHTSDTEEIGYAQYVLMFKQLTYDENSTKDSSKIIKSIEVHNEHGTYMFARDENMDFVIDEHESTPYDRTVFAQLAVACGYTLSMKRLDTPVTLSDGSIDYSEYGLASEIRTRVQTDEHGNQVETEYQYQPAWYIITTMSGESHKVIIGDMTVTETGYYARYEGRDTIYVLGASGITDLVLGKVEAFVTPTLVYPMGETNYFNVSDFTIYDDIDYKTIMAELEKLYGDGQAADENEIYEAYEKYLEKYSRKICDFSYKSLEEREGTLNAHIPYISELEYAEGYYVNSSSIDKALYGFYKTSFTEVVKLSPSEEDLVRYGLDYAPHIVYFVYHTTDDNGDKAYVQNYVEISEMNEDGIYYAYSPNYDMIVSVHSSSFDFLEWDELMWYDPSYIQLDISHVKDIIIESPHFSTHFEIEDSASKYATYTAKSGKSFKYGDVEYKIVKNELTGRYILTCNGAAVAPTYEGDYLITPAVYTPGVPQGENYILADTSEVDTNKDGVNDAYLYYFYVIGYNGKEYALAAQVVLTDMNGNRLAEDQLVWGESVLGTDYFVTNSGYVYFTSKLSYIGRYLEETYGEKRGWWTSGNVFATSDGQYVLVDADTGDWSIIGDTSCGIYFADRTNSRLAQRAVDLPALYNDQGKLTRYPEIYYPTTDKKIQYNEESGKIMAYNKTSKMWENITHSDCTIGVWNQGAYYVLDNSNIVVINEESGDWGIVTVSHDVLYIADIIADGKLLDYTVSATNEYSKSDMASAMENFQQFYKALLYGSLEGMTELDETEKAALGALDDFSGSDSNNPCQLKITVIACDIKGNERNTVYRFYQYSERKSYVTIETLGSDISESDPEKAYGNFYVLRSFVDKIISDAEKVVDGEAVTAASKY